jgi:hypothetical protein
MEKDELFQKISKEIQTLYNEQSMTEEEYKEQFGEIEDYEDKQSMDYYFFEVNNNLEFRYKKLYYKILFFLSEYSTDTIVNLFNEKFKEKMFDKKLIREEKEDDFYHAYYPVLIYEIQIFFNSLKMFYLPDDEQKENQTLKQVLDTMLNSLDFFVKDVSIQKEKDFTDEIKRIIRTVFPTCQPNPSKQFRKKIKTYYPDILIPDVKTALEMKYIDSNEKLKECIEQIDIDEQGYTGNNNYLHFYSIFYLTKMFASEEEINVMWQERSHPNNWKLILVYNVK